MRTPSKTNVRFMALDGAFVTLHDQSFASRDEAMLAVQEHAKSGGYRDVQIKHDDDEFEWRYTATTPGGRAGKNIAYGDCYPTSS